jgi:hypothetical protein
VSDFIHYHEEISDHGDGTVWVIGFCWFGVCRGPSRSR